MKQVVVFDLDDTLFYEADFVLSAYRHIAGYIETTKCETGVIEFIDSCISQQQNVFDRVSERYGITVPSLVELYRTHKPDIHLAAGTKQLLEQLKAANITMGIITDGRSLTQRNKVEALGLYQYMAYDDVIISEESGSTKPNPDNYRLFETRYPDCTYTYVGDNVNKDFIAPNVLGWKTVCLLDKGGNIHAQHFNGELPVMPKQSIRELNELLTIVLNNNI